MNTELEGLPRKTMSKQKLSDSLNKKYLKTKVQNVLSQKSFNLFPKARLSSNFFMFVLCVT